MDTDIDEVLYELFEETSPDDIPRRIQLCEQALTHITTQDDPYLWATLHSVMAFNLLENTLDDPVDNLERAIYHNRQALSVFTEQDNPEAWAVSHYNLGCAYLDRLQGVRAENLEQAIDHLNQCLVILTLQDHPSEWVMANSRLGDAYFARIRGERAQNLEEALFHYQKSLTIYAVEQFPEDWAMIQNNIGNVYARRIHGERRENLEEAIRYYERASTIYTQDSFPTDWALVQNNLGNIYQERIHGDRAENMEEAIRLYEQALTIRQRHLMPEAWAGSQNNLGNAYLYRTYGERAENLERAISCIEQALTVRTREERPEEWAASQRNLGEAYRYRIRGNRAENLEQAISHYEQASTVFTKSDFPMDWAMNQNSLGLVYAARIHGERAENLERAIHYYQQALIVHTQSAYPNDWALIHINLGEVYRERIRGERAENFERAIHHFKEALQIVDRITIPDQWAMVQNGLGNTYLNRIRGDRVENIEQALEYYKRALTIHTRQAFPSDWAMTQNNLGEAYRERIHGEHAQNLEQAIHHFQQALTLFSEQSYPREWAMVQSNLGSVYGGRQQGNRAQNLEQAILHYQYSLRMRTREAFPEEWAGVQNNLAFAYLERINGESGANMKQAIHHFEQALTVFSLEAFPNYHRRAQQSLGHIYFDNADWAKAAEAYNHALAAAELLYQVSATVEARQAELDSIQEIPVRLAYALGRSDSANQENLQQMAMLIEQYRARWLGEALSLRSEKPANLPIALWQAFTDKADQIQKLQTEAQLPDNTPGKRDYITLTEQLSIMRRELEDVVAQIHTYAPDFMAMSRIADAEAALTSTAENQTEVGIYLSTTSYGGLALLVHHDGIVPVWLDKLTDEALMDALRDWFDAYDRFLRQRNTDAWDQWLEQMYIVTGELWRSVMGPIASTLAELGIPSKGSNHSPVVTLVPTGLLALLPLHASWMEDGATSTGRRYFMDDYAVRYSPSATALRYCRERAKDTTVKQLLAIDEPKPVTHSGPLPNSSREVKAITSLFPESTVLQHEQANRGTTRDALFAAQVAHFSCHGANNWQNPLYSGLLLANDELLTVRDFLERHLPNARLATLSACETGIVGTDLPDEVIMLPSALVQAGYAGVVASLWSVADVSTAMLMVRFYQFWREDGLEPVYALRAAQRWVRDTTNQEKADYFGQFVPGLTPRMADTVAAEFFSAAMLAEDGPEARSFAHPFWWGAFYLTGV